MVTFPPTRRAGLPSIQWVSHLGKAAVPSGTVGRLCGSSHAGSHLHKSHFCAAVRACADHARTLPQLWHTCRVDMQARVPQAGPFCFLPHLSRLIARMLPTCRPACVAQARPRLFHSPCRHVHAPLISPAGDQPQGRCTEPSHAQVGVVCIKSCALRRRAPCTQPCVVRRE